MPTEKQVDAAAQWLHERIGAVPKRHNVRGMLAAAELAAAEEPGRVGLHILWECCACGRRWSVKDGGTACPAGCGGCGANIRAVRAFEGLPRA